MTTSIWTSVKVQWPEIGQECIFYDPFSDFVGNGRFWGDGFHLAGEIYKGTHWVKVEKPDKDDVQQTIDWLKEKAE